MFNFLKEGGQWDPTPNFVTGGTDGDMQIFTDGHDYAVMVNNSPIVLTGLTLPLNSNIDFASAYALGYDSYPVSLLRSR